MKTILMIAAASALALTATATVASAQDTSGQTSYASVGVTSTHGNKTGTSLSGINARIGTKLTPHFGVEGEAAFGTNKDTGPDGKYKLTDKVAAYGVGYLPVSSNFDLLARVGVADTRLKRPDIDTTKDESGTSLDYGVGAQYHMTRDYALRADVTESDFVNHKGTANTATLSLVKAF